MKAFFRCDANQTCGLGHLTRCLAIAEVVLDLGGEVEFFGDYTKVAISKIEEITIKPTIIDCNKSNDNFLKILQENTNIDLIVMDCYGICYDEHFLIAKYCKRLLAVDDFGSLPSYDHCAGVLNFTARSKQISYRINSNVNLFKGLKYFPANKALRAARELKYNAPQKKAENILILLGGFAANEVITRVAEAVNFAIEAKKLTNARMLISSSQIDNFPIGKYKIQFIKHASDVIEHYLWADACLSGGGMSKYESAFLGIPTGICSMNEGQDLDTKEFCKMGLGFDFDFSIESFPKNLDKFLKGMVSTDQSRLHSVENFAPHLFSDAISRFFQK